MATNIRKRYSRADGLVQFIDTDATQLDASTNPVSTVVAAGSALADGTAINTLPASGVVKVTGGDGTKGVALPPSIAGMQVMVLNVASAVLKVYPNSATGVINALSAGAAISVASQTSAIFTAMDSLDNWYTTPRVPS